MILSINLNLWENMRCKEEMSYSAEELKASKGHNIVKLNYLLMPLTQFLLDQTCIS
jgi:hypothetical protein